MIIKIKQLKSGKFYISYSIKNILSDEDGNSMIEFALVLPLLILLTVGTVFLSINFAQKSILNGLAFMETRAASVRQQHTKIAEHAVQNYRKQTDGHQKWIEKAKSEIKEDNSSGDLTIIVSKDAENTEMLSNVINMIGGNKPNGKTEIKKIKSAMTLPIEYIVFSKRSDRPFTSTTIDYETKPVGGDFIDKNLLDKLPESVRKLIIPKSLVDPKKDIGSPDDGQVHDSKRADRVLSANAMENMERLNKSYAYWGLDRLSRSEAPENITIDNLSAKTVNTLGFMKASGEYISVIENGTDVLKLATQLSGFGYAIETILQPIQAVGAVGLPIVEKVGTKFAETAEINNNRMFKKSLLGIGN